MIRTESCADGGRVRIAYPMLVSKRRIEEGEASALETPDTEAPVAN
eukprot:gene11685-34408_t